MNAVAENEFLAWASSRGVVPDERYSPPRCLVYEADRGESRFWELPESPDQRLSFLSNVLSGLDRWEFCNVWPRGGVWHNPTPCHSRMDEARALARFGGRIPDGFRGALKYSTAETESLLNLIDARSRTAWCVSNDLFVLPDHAAQFLYLDHHGVVHVECADLTGMDRFIEHMTRGGYTLPEEVPDATFKRPGWMR